MKTMPFHLSLPCYNLKDTIDFYKTVMGAKIGRAFVNWVDINLYGTSITFVESRNHTIDCPNYTFDNKILPSFHFGIVVQHKDWLKFLENVKGNEENYFSPVRYLDGKPGEHQSFFVEDPNGHMVELKTFEVPEEIFTVNR